MMLKRAFLHIIILILITMVFPFQTVIASGSDIYINGNELSADLKPEKIKGEIMVKARVLANNLDLKIEWINEIRTLKLKKADKTIKMMEGSSYLQIGNNTLKSNNGMYIKNGHTYIPLKPVVEGFGYLTNYNKDEDSMYVFKPEAYVSMVKWGPRRQKIIIEMNQITPYRINKTEDGKKLIIEIDKASLASGFIDDISNHNYYLEVDKSKVKARLRITITSKFPIPFINESGIEEGDGALILNLSPQLKEIKWQKDKTLAIKSTGKITEPATTILHNPRRMVLDFPGIMLAEHKNGIKENEYIKKVRVSQFKYDPLILRVVIELKEDKFLQTAENNTEKNTYLLTTIRKRQVSDLSWNKDRLLFMTSSPVKPEIFSLENPDRLVINLPNTVRAEDFQKKLKIEDTHVKDVRTSRFDKGVIRIVVDLKKKAPYNWSQKKSGNKFLHEVVFAEKFDKIKLGLTDKENFTDIDISFQNKVDYEIKKFSYPDRLVVDIEDLKVDKDRIQIPEPVGMIKKIETGQYTNQNKEFTRLVFTLNDYYGYETASQSPGSSINISLPAEKKEEQPEKIDQKKEKRDSKLIVLDAGHGGFDPGAVGPSGLTEKEVNLKIALKIEKLLEEADYRVVMTREKDEFISLNKRVEIANETEAALFVSIHNNSSIRGYSEGTEVYLAPDREKECLRLAQRIHDKLIQELGLLDRGVKKENFYVIKHTEMPAALVEIAFLSNSHEESLLNSKLFRDRAARAITQAIIDYIGNHE